MKINIKKLSITPEHLLKKCGYLEILNPHTQENSFVRSFDFGRFYPRFHIYPETRPGQFILNLHLDAKKPSYEGTSAHSGEYDGEIVEQEAARIQRVADKFLSQPPAAGQELGFHKKASWLEKILKIFQG